MNVCKAITFRASSIGDCLMGKYLLENIHTQYPNARLGILVASRAQMIRDLFAAYPWLEIVEANRRNPRALFRLLRDFHGSDIIVTQYAGKKGGRFGLASKLFARFLARRGGLIGFADAFAWNGALYDRLLPVLLDQSVAEHEREALAAAGTPVSLPFPRLACLPDDAVVEKFGLAVGKYIVVHFFAGGKGRSLSPEKSRELLIAFRSALPTDVSILVSGSVVDRVSAESIARDTGAKVIAGEATLQDMMNLIRRSEAVVSVDTGMAHIAAELEVPLVVLRTCLGRQWWLPGQYGADAPIKVFSCDEVCAAGHRYQEYPDCLGAIPLETVVEAARARMLPGRIREG